MRRSLVLGLLVSLQSKISLVSMSYYEANSRLFVIKMADLYHVARQSYSKNSHGSYILKTILILCRSQTAEYQR